MKSIFNLNNQNLSIDGKIIAGLDKLVSVHRNLIWEQSKKFGLSPIQIQLLLFMNYHKAEYTTVSYLAKEFQVTKPTISDAVKMLFQKELVVKIENSTDARSYAMQLTAEGIAIVQETELFTRSLQYALQFVNETSKQEVWELLSKILFQLTQMDVISVNRMCFSCQFYSQNGQGHYCNLLFKSLANHEIRMDCEEHVVKVI
ncbi:MarR family winged helix-turn-helix transcriptional regulator [Flavobacterium sp.]|uniref:MarR family winged helix-turn-helix transcriptional regulator n=1 Tax=Flavobacterium sp. TaxID=239 RepID=UPI003D0F81EA